MLTATGLSDELLNRMRKEGDPEADAFIRREFATPEKKMHLFGWLKQVKDNNALNQIPQAYSQENFISRNRALPNWADAKLMQTGSAFFIKYAEQIMQLLGLLSLPYCYAAADGALVLHLSDRLKTDSAKRLTDTAEFIWSVMSPEAFKKQGSGFANCLAIRLTHAGARYYTTKTENWNLGMPVNQEDMAGTNLAFSLIVIRGLRKLGYSISDTDQQAFIHLWGVIGYLLGLSEQLIPANGKTATALERKINERQFRQSEHGQELTRALITCFRSASPENIPKDQVTALMRFLTGEKVADLLDIPRTPLPPLLPGILQLSALRTSFGASQPTLAEYRKKYTSYKKGIESQFLRSE